MTRRAILKGTGSALPRTRVSNDELAKRVDTSDEWIVERTGIRFRHIAEPDETTGTLGADAAREALKAAGLDAADRSEEHTSELQSLMRNSYAVLCLKKKKRDEHDSTTIQR